MNQKEKILSYTSETFLKNGYYKTTVEEIARTMGIGKNTIYKYFSNKDELLIESIKYVIRNNIRKVKFILNNKDSAIEKLINMFNWVSSNIMRGSDKYLKDLQVHNPEIWLMIDEMRKKLMVRNITKLIEQGKKEKIFIDYPIEILVSIFIASLRAVINPDFLLNNKFSMAEAFTYTYKILLNAILSDKGKILFKKLKLHQ